MVLLNHGIVSFLFIYLLIFISKEEKGEKKGGEEIIYSIVLYNCSYFAKKCIIGFIRIHIPEFKF